jgi:hypothetical protein
MSSLLGRWKIHSILLLIVKCRVVTLCFLRRLTSILRKSHGFPSRYPVGFSYLWLCPIDFFCYSLSFLGLWKFFLITRVDRSSMVWDVDIGLKCKRTQITTQRQKYIMLGFEWEIQYKNADIKNIWRNLEGGLTVPLCLYTFL